MISSTQFEVLDQLFRKRPWGDKAHEDEVYDDSGTDEFKTDGHSTDGHPTPPAASLLQTEAGGTVDPQGSLLSAHVVASIDAAGKVETTPAGGGLRVKIGASLGLPVGPEGGTQTTLGRGRRGRRTKESSRRAAGFRSDRASNRVYKEWEKEQEGSEQASARFQSYLNRQSLSSVRTTQLREHDLLSKLLDPSIRQQA